MSRTAFLSVLSIDQLNFWQQYSVRVLILQLIMRDADCGKSFHCGCNRHFTLVAGSCFKGLAIVKATVQH